MRVEVMVPEDSQEMSLLTLAQGAVRSKVWREKDCFM